MSTSESSPTVVLVDDHAMVREALAQLLEEEGIRVLGQAGERHEAARLIAATQPEVLLLDYSFPGGGALPLIESLRAGGNPPRILVLTVHESLHYAVRVLEAGADGYLIKSSAVSELVDGIRAVHAGEIYVTPKLAGAVFRHLRDGRGERTGVEALSTREFELLRLLAAGSRLKDAARVLNISTSTASTYRTRLMEKLKVESTAELIRFALENDISG